MVWLERDATRSYGDQRISGEHAAKTGKGFAVEAIVNEAKKEMAGTTGLEPAASAVTGQRSNQLNYVPTRQINKMRNNQCLCSFPLFASSAPIAPEFQNGVLSAVTAYKIRVWNQTRFHESQREKQRTTLQKYPNSFPCNSKVQPRNEQFCARGSIHWASQPALFIRDQE